MRLLLLSFIFGGLFTGCNPADSSEITPIKAGQYEQKAQKITVGDSLVTAAPVGGYFQKSFQFHEGMGVTIEITSDIASENGTAKAHYSVSGDRLTVEIQKSTTSYYKSNNKVTFHSFKEVNESYSHSFETGNNSYVFHGPGLLLTTHQPDEKDLDDDGNTSETVATTEYYKYGVQYD